jgi:hypothetical protein
MQLTQAQLVKLGIALGICYGATKVSSNPMVKTAAVAVGAVIIARQLPYVGSALTA